MPPRIAAPPAACAGPNASPNATVPASEPTSGSRLTNAPASSAGTRPCAHVKSQNAPNVPGIARPPIAATAAGAAGLTGRPSNASATGSETRVAPPSCTAVTAPASRPASSRGWITMNAADPAADASTSASPIGEVPAPPAPATRATPPTPTSAPSQAGGPAEPCPATTLRIATSTGTAPTISAAWPTLVRSIPAFWSRITVP
jgi:hypothetical protein